MASIRHPPAPVVPQSFYRPLSQHVAQIFSAILDWSGEPETREKIDFACYKDGGWEGWAQVEIAYMLCGRAWEWRSIAKCLSVYTDHSVRKADLVIGTTAGPVIIELKCESDNSSQQFNNDVLRDWDKIRGARIIRRLRNYVIYSVALSLILDGHEYTVGSEFDSGDQEIQDRAAVHLSWSNGW